MKLNIISEIAPLKKVLLHRPSEEIKNITPAFRERLLFNEIPSLKVAQEEHDVFANTLRKQGVQIYYLEDLVTESLNTQELKEKFINEFLIESGVTSAKQQDTIMSLNTRRDFAKVIYL